MIGWKHTGATVTGDDPFDHLDLPTPSSGFSFNRLHDGYSGYVCKDWFDTGNGGSGLVDIGFGDGISYDEWLFDQETWDTESSMLAGMVESTMHTWYNQYAGPNLVQATENNRPLTSDGVGGGVHSQGSSGKLSVDFDGSAHYMAAASDAMSLYGGSNDHTLAILGEGTNSVAVDNIMSSVISAAAVQKWCLSDTGATVSGATTSGRKQSSTWYNTSGNTARNTTRQLYVSLHRGTGQNMNIRSNEESQGTVDLSGSAEAGTVSTEVGRADSVYGNVYVEGIFIWNTHLTTWQLKELDKLRTWWG